MEALMTPDLVRLDVDLGADKEAVIAGMAAVAVAAGRAADPVPLERDLLAREAKSPTGMKGGIAIPHCRSAAVSEPTLAFARLSPAVEFGAKDGPAQLVFCIMAPDGGGEAHLQILTKLARALVRSEFTDALRAASTRAEVVAIVDGVVGEAPAAAAAPAAPAASVASVAPAAAKPSLVAVTSCPTGIAHTYMAAEALEAAAARAGVEIAVETQGSAGATPLRPDTIAAAGAVIFATDVGVRDRARFAGKPVVQSGVKRPIDDGDAMIAEAVRLAADPSAPRVEGSADAATAETGGGSWGSQVRRVLMTGVSYMIPFVAAGGLLIALGFLLGGYDSAFVSGDILVKHSLTNLPSPAAYDLHHVLFDSPFMLYLGVLLFFIGKTAFALFVPVLAGYIAYAIADRPGLAPGFVMGALATNLAGFAANDGAAPAVTGFIGAIVGGALAGGIALWISRWKVPSWARGLMPVLVIPLLTSIIAGLIMLLVLGKPVAALMNGLNDGLNSMNGGSSVILGVVLGLMMAFDMGGPLNKVAYAFATAGIGTAAATAGDAPQLKVMAAVMLAGMVPPIALALATVVRPRLFTAAEHENGKAAWLMGASFITEGAIPFAAADPLRVIPSIMLGSAVTGGLAEAMNVTLRAPHGGIFVLFAVGNIGGFLVALAAGVLVAAAAVVALKSVGSTPASAEPVAEAVAA